MITVKLHTSLKRYCPGCNRTGSIKIKFEEGLTVGKILKELNLNHGEVGIILINGSIVDENFELSKEDIIELFPVVGGG